MRVTLCITVILLASLLSAQSSTPVDGFSLKLERIGWLGRCPDYKVSIQSDGTLHYEGRFYVHSKGVREKKLSQKVLQRLAKRLQDEDFFHWEQTGGVCLDTPETRITATLKGVEKHAMEGCNTPGKVLKLADEIEKITGLKRWI